MNKNVFKMIIVGLVLLTVVSIVLNLVGVPILAIYLLVTHSVVWVKAISVWLLIVWFLQLFNITKAVSKFKKQINIMREQIDGSEREKD